MADLKRGRGSSAQARTIAEKIMTEHADTMRGWIARVIEAGVEPKTAATAVYQLSFWARRGYSFKHYPHGQMLLIAKGGKD